MRRGRGSRKRGVDGRERKKERGGERRDEKEVNSACIVLNNYA